MVSLSWPVVASLVAAAGTLYVVGHLRQYRGKPGADWFLASLGWQTVWSVGYGVALLVYDPVLRAALEALVWAAMTGTSVAFLAFALAYTGRARLPGGWRTVVAVPVVVALVGGTNPLHGAVWTGFELAPVAGMATVTYDLRAWALVGATVGVLLVSVGSLLLFDTVLSYGPLYRGEAVAVGLSTVPPVAALLVWLYGLGPVPELNLATVAFLPHVALDAYAFVGSDMFEFHPATRRAGERAAIDDLGAPVVIVDERSRVVTLNGAAESAFGVGKAAALTRPLEDVVGEAVDPAGEDDTVTVREGRRTVYAVTATPLTDAADTHVGYTVVFQDVTEERRREQRLDVLNRVLRHNVRNEMTAVRGFVEAASGRIDDAETASMLDRATGAADDLVSLTETAREAERVLDGDGTTERVAIDSFLADVAARHRGTDPEATVDAAATDLTVTTDPVVLRAVLNALVENALAHAGPGASVALAAERRGDRVAVTVTDDGPGIPDHEREVVDAGAESALEHGSGLGLWLANWGATTLGGSLSLAADGGTTATVELPADAPETQAGA